MQTLTNTGHGKEATYGRSFLLWVIATALVAIATLMTPGYAYANETEDLPQGTLTLDAVVEETPAIDDVTSDDTLLAITEDAVATYVEDSAGQGSSLANDSAVSSDISDSSTAAPETNGDSITDKGVEASTDASTKHEDTSLNDSKSNDPSISEGEIASNADSDSSIIASDSQTESECDVEITTNNVKQSTSVTDELTRTDIVNESNGSRNPQLCVDDISSIPTLSAISNTDSAITEHLNPVGYIDSSSVFGANSSISTATDIVAQADVTMNVHFFVTYPSTMKTVTVKSGGEAPSTITFGYHNDNVYDDDYALIGTSNNGKDVNLDGSYQLSFSTTGLVRQFYRYGAVYTGLIIVVKSARGTTYTRINSKDGKIAPQYQGCECYVLWEPSGAKQFNFMDSTGSPNNSAYTQTDVYPDNLIRVPSWVTDESTRLQDFAGWCLVDDTTYDGSYLGLLSPMLMIPAHILLV